MPWDIRIEGSCEAIPQLWIVWSVKFNAMESAYWMVIGSELTDNGKDHTWHTSFLEGSKFSDSQARPIPRSCDTCRWLRISQSKGVRNNGSTHREVSSRAKFSLVNWDCRYWMTPWRPRLLQHGHKVWAINSRLEMKKPETRLSGHYQIWNIDMFRFWIFTRHQGTRQETRNIFSNFGHRPLKLR
jgi:hypothetical protein